VGLVDKPAFTAGELDPSLWERTNLDKYRNGLATARSWIISKTGSILTRQGRQFFASTKLLNRAVRLYSPPGGGVLLEWGHQYVRVYNLTTWGLLGDIAHGFLESDLPNIHFDTSGSYVYIFCAGKNVLKFNYATGVFISQGAIFALPPKPAAGAVTQVGTPTGYNVQYVITYVINGEESLAFGPLVEVSSGHPYVKLPIAAGQTITVGGTLGPIAPTTNPNPFLTEMRVYRRPYDATNVAGGGAYGYVGSSTDIQVSIGELVAIFTDIGADADYSHQPPSSVLPGDVTSASGAVEDPGNLLSNTGVIYQQRLLITDFVTDLQAIYASQPGFQDNFYRNYPLDAASALKFKCGTSGYARVYRLLDSDGLVAFTAAGVYLNQGELGPDNLSMIKKGKWIINPIVPPLAVPGGVMFLDSATNGVRNLLWSFQLNAFDADEVSIYSNHIFRSRQLQTWNFQQGAFPLLWVVFTDGTAASFTFDYNQQMQAWTRHDGALPLDVCCGTTNPDQSFFVTKKTDLAGNVTRYIEITLPRYVPPFYISSDPDYDKNASCAYMDSIVTGEIVLNLGLKGTDGFTFATTQVNDDGTPNWGGILNLDCGTSAIWLALVQVPPGPSSIFYRFFDEDGSVIDLELLTVVDVNHIQVQVVNVDEFPSDWAVKKVKLYQTFTTITGLTMFEQEYPGVIVDGAVVCSPNNDQENYAQLQVVNGVLTLPAGTRAAIMHIGRPIVGDLETLDIDTVEQQPTLIESLVVNKVYVKVKDAKSLYIGPTFPNGANGESVNGVTGMYPIDSFPVDYTQANPIIGNRAQPAQTKRYEILTQGDYSQQGKICIRQVDPLHAEILSFIPDVEVQKRQDR
jgi:hypothetical protein